MASQYFNQLGYSKTICCREKVYFHLYAKQKQKQQLTVSNSRAYKNHPLASKPTRYRFLSSYTNRVLFLSKLKNQFFFYYKLLFSYFCIIFYLLYFVKILFLILIAFTKCNLFFVTSSKHWVPVFRAFPAFRSPFLYSWFYTQPCVLIDTFFY